MSLQGHSTRGGKKVELSLLCTLNLDASLHDTRIFIDGLKAPVGCGLIISCYECYPGPDLDIFLTAYLHGLNYAYHLRPENCPFFVNARRLSLYVWNGSSDGSGSHTVDEVAVAIKILRSGLRPRKAVLAKDGDRRANCPFQRCVV
jgi:hypothetical protein